MPMLQVPMEYNHLQEIPIVALRNRLLLLHHLSELFCPCIPMFDLEGALGEAGLGPSVGFDTLRGILISQGKVTGRKRTLGLPACGSFRSCSSGTCCLPGSTLGVRARLDGQTDISSAFGAAFPPCGLCHSPPRMDCVGFAGLSFHPCCALCSPGPEAL